MKHLTIIAVFLVQTALGQTGDMKGPDFKISIPNDFMISFDPDILIGNWFSLHLSLINTRGETFLQGEQPLENFVGYDKKKYVEIVYVSMPGEPVPVVRILPARLMAHTQSPDEAFCFRYVIEQGVFRLTVKNSDPSTLTPDLDNAFKDFRYRYILIPRSVYQGSKIDWSSYEAVALALNL